MSVRRSAWQRWPRRLAVAVAALSCAGVAASTSGPAAAAASRVLTLSAPAHGGMVEFRLARLRGLVVRSATLRSGRLRIAIPLRRVRAAARRGHLRVRVPAGRRRWQLRVVAARPRRADLRPPRDPRGDPAPTARPAAPSPAPPVSSASPAPPVRTGTAGDLGLTTATLTATADAPVTYRFEWGTRDFAETSPWRHAAAGPVAERVGGLSEDTTYRFRIVTDAGDAGEAAGFTTRRRDTVPATGALFGAWHRRSGQWSAGALLDFERTLGRRLAIDAHYRDWTEEFPAAPELFDRAGGRLPLVSWDYMGPLDRILDGSQDAVIRAAADRVRAYDAPVLLRPWYEMNGDWWPGSYQGAFNNDPGQTNGPAKFVAAWRRLHDLFAEEGAANAVWVWTPNCSDWPAEAWNHWTNYYPGDAYVDWVGCDEYNWGHPWASFRGLFGGDPSVYGDYPQKPFMIAETAACDTGGDKAAWIADARDAIEGGFTRLRAFVWFDEQVDPDCDWRVDSSSESLAAYRALGADPYFQPDDGLPVDTVAPAAPAAPAAAPAGPGALRLDWGAGTEPDLAAYRVYRETADGTWAQIATADASDRGYTDSGLSPGVSYRYRIAAVDAAGNESGPSAVASAVAGG